jgi:hypothetical protein
MNSRITKALVLSVALAAGGCAQAGSLGDILGGVLNAPAQSVGGTIQGVDTRAQTIFVRTTDNQTISIAYDDRTAVVYQNQNYPVTALESGDQVNVRITQTSNGAYYTDRVDVTQSSSTGTGTNSNDNIQQVQGTVRQIDLSSGRFTISTTNQGTLTVSMPYNSRSQDVDRFRSLRSGDYVRLYGTYLSNTQIQLVQFY